MGSLYIEVQGYVPMLLENLRGMSCSGTCWPLGGTWFSVGMEVFDELLLINVPWIRSSLVFSGFGLKPPASGLIFSLILIIASRLLHLYSTNDKTSRLMMKSFSTVRDTQRGTPGEVHRVTWRREEGGGS